MNPKIKKRWATDGGDYDCIEYTITVPFQETMVYEHQYRYKVSPSEKTKYENILTKQVPKTEIILDYGFSYYINEGLKIVIFNLNTKPIKAIQKEEEVIKKLQNTKYKQKYSRETTTIDENNYIQLTNIPLNEQDIQKVKQILNGETWYIKETRDDGTYLKIKLKEF